MLQPGTRAPAFCLQDGDGNTVALENLRGQRVVLYFYPRDNTSGCTTQACGLRDAWPDFSGTGSVILGVSPDDVDSHRKFHAKHALPFPLLSDPDHAVADAYGAWGEKRMYGKKYMGILRTTFVIDANGTITHVFQRVRPKTHAADVLAALKG